MLIAMLMTAGVATSLDAPDDRLARAELCLVHVETLIAEAQAQTGRVAGPSWFIRDWWMARLPEEGAAKAASDQRLKALAAAMPARRTADPAAFAAERGACFDEAINAGAVPGMGPE